MASCSHVFVGRGSGAACPFCAGVSPLAAEPRRVQVGDVWEYGTSGQHTVARFEHAAGGLRAVGADGRPLDKIVDGRFLNDGWTLVRAADEKPRPKAAVGQRWRRPDSAGTWCVQRLLASGFVQLRLESDHSWSCADGKDHVLPPPWEYVGEAEATRPAELIPSDDELEAEQIACLARRLRLRRTAEAFAFLAAPEFAVHLQRLAVDNAIRACPPDLDPLGWRAAVLAWRDEFARLNRNVHPHVSTLEWAIGHLAGCIRSNDHDVWGAVIAYRRAIAPAPRVRRRVEVM